MLRLTWYYWWPSCIEGFPHSSVGKGSACNAGDPGFISGSGRPSGEGTGYPFQYSWASLVAQLVKNLPAVRETWVRSRVGKIPWRRERLPTPVFWPGGFHGLYSPWGRKESDMTVRLSLSLLKNGKMEKQRDKNIDEGYEGITNRRGKSKG